jgi:acyl dehydratase
MGESRPDRASVPQDVRPVYFEDFEAGRVYDLCSITVRENDIVAFARQFDPLPFHVDPAAAKASAFGGLIASGWHVGALFMRLLVDGLIRDAKSMGSPGMDEVRFLVPVRPGDTVTGRFTIERTEPSGQRRDRGTIHGMGELLNQRDEVVFRFRNRSFFARDRGATGAGGEELVRGLP